MKIAICILKKTIGLFSLLLLSGLFIIGAIVKYRKEGGLWLFIDFVVTPIILVGAIISVTWLFEKCKCKK